MSLAFFFFGQMKIARKPRRGRQNGVQRRHDGDDEVRWEQMGEVMVTKFDQQTTERNYNSNFAGVCIDTETGLPCMRISTFRSSLEPDICTVDDAEAILKAIFV